MALYSRAVAGFHVNSVERHGPDDPDRAGRLKLAQAALAGHELIIFDSPPIHDFTFTPAISLFVDFDNQAELAAAFDGLSDGGTVMMPLDAYGFSARYGWVSDRYGVSWQLNLP